MDRSTSMDQIGKRVIPFGSSSRKIAMVIMFISSCLSFACRQEQRSRSSDMKWLDPASMTFPVIEGRGWHDGLAAPYDRLPAKARKTVRKDVWIQSERAAGLHINFLTNAREIKVRYTVKSTKAMPQMPATGVSGVDLYARDSTGQWQWARASYQFGDTVEFHYRNLGIDASGAECRLYLPLYNEVIWMIIGVPDSAHFDFKKVAEEKPIVAYGTSIMQGGCASRPGLSWSNILDRSLGEKIINLGFASNGRLEVPVIDLINEIDAKLYILDCMPNLIDRNSYSRDEVELRIRRSVDMIRKIHPGVPILLAEHPCGSPGLNLDTALTARYMEASMPAARMYQVLMKEGMKEIYLLTAADIGLDKECTVDGTHPNDLGMMRYAEAYARIIRKILNK